jgi:hypothetical protein
LKARKSKVWVLNPVLGDDAVEANRDFMSDPLGNHIPEGFASFFTMDANVPYSEAERYFKKCYRMRVVRTPGFAMFRPTRCL